jgi:2',3'-cyclic-nucleotide 2'-phosphodiesterase (5'-nucleotidase family)
MKKVLFISFLLIAMILTACAAPALPAATPAPAASEATATPEPAESATSTPVQSASPITLTVLYTNDEHGWLLGKEEGSGAAEMMGLWRKKFGYDPADPRFIVLSGGDNWTGPAVSTWFKGESMVAVMNAMGYDASAVGNHEFDFGLDVLKERATQADFPYLAANLRNKSDGQVPTELGVDPYVILDAGGVKVGVIGLANVGTPDVTNPANVSGFDFAPYVETLREVVPQARADGADIILVASHLCNEELRYLAPKVEELGITLFGGGHCHQTLKSQAGDAVLLASGSYLENVAWATISYDPDAQKARVTDYGVLPNTGGQADADVAAIAKKWQQEADAALGEPIGYLAETIPQRSKTMQALITETWLLGYPNADIAITNLGGMRDDLRAGPVSIGDILSVMPFDNVLVDVKLTGAQLREVIAGQEGRAAVGGMHRKGICWILNDGGILDKETVYHVLVNDFMYAGGDHYDLLAQADPNAYNTSIDWRQPVIDWIIAQNSTPEQPLDEKILTTFVHPGQ